MRAQSALEEKLNAITHGFGAILGVIGLILLLIFDSHKTKFSAISVAVYGLSIILLFTASTLYHSIQNGPKKHLFRIFDHISIYFLIAGTYTPVLLIILNNSLGWHLFYVVWGIAVFGIVLKAFFTGKFEIFSTVLYVLMGWLIVFDFNNLALGISQNGVTLLFAGGMAYTLGIVFYAIEKISFNHVIWHLFVLTGAVCHFFMIFLYVI